jgi:hypothetical protein
MGEFLKYGACRYAERGGSKLPGGVMNMAMLGMAVRLSALCPHITYKVDSW